MTNLRILLVGDSGTGKTGALWSLIEAGYSVALADFDNGADILRIKAAQAKPGLASRLHIVPLRDIINSVGESITIAEPLAIVRFVRALNKWPGIDKSLTQFSADTVFCIDTLNFLSRAVMYRFQHTNRKLDKPVEPINYNIIQNEIRVLLDRLVSDQYQCSIIVNTHLDYREVREGTSLSVGMMERDVTGTDPKKISTADTEVKGVPTAFGAKLGPQVGAYFNFTLRATQRMIGNKVARRIQTASTDEVVDLKCPLDLPTELPLDTGLATIFKAWRDLGLA
jgi:hypothetical protein